MMPAPCAFYFGSLRESGHFLHEGGTQGRSTLRPEKIAPDFPWTIGHLDTGFLKNGKVRDHPDGRVHWTCGGVAEGDERLWHAFYWWDQSDDSRPGSNSGFYVFGFKAGQQREAFAFGCAVWPDVVRRQRFPLVLVE